MRYKAEPISKCQKELAALIDKYYAANPKLNDDLPPLAMNWDYFTNLHDRGMLFLLCARNDDGKLIGCAMYVLAPHPQHIDSRFAYCNTLAVDPDERRKGIGTKLVTLAMAMLKSMGAQYMTHGFRTVYDETPLFPKLGFKLTEQTFIKELN